MVSRQVGIAAVCFLLGVVIISSVPYLVLRPTVGAPNYWANHTGGLTELVFVTVVGGAFVTTGFAALFRSVPLHTGETSIRISGLMAILGGLLTALSASPPVTKILPAMFDRGVSAFPASRIAGSTLLIIGVVGTLAHYRVSGRWGQYGAGAIAGGFTLLAGADLLRWALRSFEPQTGALDYPPLGLTLAGTFALVAGSVLLGFAIRQRTDAPRWLGPLLVAAGLLSVPLGALAIVQYLEPIRFYGLTWVVVGGHVIWTGSTDESHRVE